MLCISSLGRVPTAFLELAGGEDEFTRSDAFVRYHPNYEATPAKTTLKSLTLAQGGFGVKDHESRGSFVNRSLSSKAGFCVLQYQVPVHL